MEHYLGRFKKSGTANLLLLPEEGVALFEAENGSATSAKIIWTNRSDVSIGEVWQVASEEKPMPNPKVVANKEVSKY